MVIKLTEPSVEICGIIMSYLKAHSWFACGLQETECHRDVIFFFISEGGITLVIELTFLINFIKSNTYISE